MKIPSCAVLVLLTGCGGAVVPDEATPSKDAGAWRDARREAAERPSFDAGRLVDGGGEADSYVVYQDEPCPEVVLEPPSLECDPFATTSQCPPDEGCYPIPPRATDACHPGRYATRCLPAGRGTRGAPCGGGGDCAGGFICVKSSSGDQCVQLCRTSEYGSCGDGRICVEVDVTGAGWGGCQ